MTFADYLRLLGKRWYVVAACLALGLGAGLAVSTVVAPTYDARATLYFSTVVTGPASGSISAYETNLLAEQQLKSVSLLVGTDRVAQDVIDDLQLPVTAGQLIPHLSATSDPDTVVLAVDATDPSPQRAADIANSTGRALVRLTDTINKQNAEANSPTVLPAVRAQVIQAAVVPAVPSGGTRGANVLGGLLAGLLVGMAVVLLRALLDRKVRSGDQLAALASAPAVGATPRAAGLRSAPMSVAESPGGELASAYRQLRVNLSAVLADRRVLAVVSARPGDGRSLTVCNLAAAFAEAGCRVVVLEADLRNPRIADYLGFGDEYGLADVLAGTRTTAEVVRSWQGRFDVVLAGRERAEPSHLVASGRMTSVLDELEADHDVVLVDTPAASAGADVAVLGARADAVLLLARQARTRKTEVERLAEEQRLASAVVVGSVLTMEKGRRFRRRPAPARPLSRPSVEPVDLDPPTIRNVPAVVPRAQPADDGGARESAAGSRAPTARVAGPLAAPSTSAATPPTTVLPLPVRPVAARSTPGAGSSVPVSSVAGSPVRPPVLSGAGRSPAAPLSADAGPVARRSAEPIPSAPPSSSAAASSPAASSPAASSGVPPARSATVRPAARPPVVAAEVSAPAPSTTTPGVAPGVAVTTSGRPTARPTPSAPDSASLAAAAPRPTTSSATSSAPASATPAVTSSAPASSAPVPSTSMSSAPVPSTSMSSAPVPSTSTSSAPVPSTSMSSSAVPAVSSARASAVVSKPATSSPVASATSSPSAAPVTPPVTPPASPTSPEATPAAERGPSGTNGSTAPAAQPGVPPRGDAASAPRPFPRAAAARQARDTADS